MNFVRELREAERFYCFDERSGPLWTRKAAQRYAALRSRVKILSELRMQFRAESQELSRNDAVEIEET